MASHALKPNYIRTGAHVGSLNVECKLPFPYSGI